MSKLDVICIGSATQDSIAAVPRMPGADERLLADEFVNAGGGPAATAAVTLARLGVSVGFCGVVGDDDAGVRVCASLEREGVDVRWLRVKSGARTAQSSIIVSGDARAIVAWPAAEPAPDEIPVRESTWLHVDQTGFLPTLTALRNAASSPSGSSDVRLSVDAGNPLPESGLTGVDLFVPSVVSLRSRYPEATSLSEAFDAAQNDGARAVIATDGARGSHLRSDGRETHVDAFDGPVVSTLGAGDVFHGALVAALVWGHSLEAAASAASAVAALSCRALDGRSAIPDRDELDRFLSARTTPRGP